MNRVLIGIGVGVVVIAVIVVVTAVKTYNGLIDMEERVDQRWAEIDNMLQRRADLIPNLVSTVKGYATHEEEILTRVAEARSALIGAHSIEEKGAAAGQLNAAIGRLLAIAENYPNLKADRNFLHLQDELAGTENRIAVARTRYNEAVQQFNARIRRIPWVFFANAMGLDKRSYFEVADETDKAVPKVEFE